MTFQLHPNFEKKIYLCDLPLSRLLLEDERHYPWLLLIPRVPNVSRLTDLSWPDQLQCLRELDQIQKVLLNQFNPTQLNVAAIGNKTPQLHIHVIARFANDPAWPHTVWDHPVRAPYDEPTKAQLIATLRSILLTHSSNS